MSSCPAARQSPVHPPRTLALIEGEPLARLRAARSRGDLRGAEAAAAEFCRGRATSLAAPLAQLEIGLAALCAGDRGRAAFELAGATRHARPARHDRIVFSSLAHRALIEALRDGPQAAHALLSEAAEIAARHG